ASCSNEGPPRSEQYCLGTDSPVDVVVRLRRRVPSPAAKTIAHVCPASFTATPPFEASAQRAPAYVQPSRRGYSRAYLPRTEHPYTYTAIFARHRARPTSTIRCARAHTMAAGLSDSLHDARRYAATTTPESKRLA